ncbi:hypothetical protein [Aquimarina aggregata]|uniref:hypothetical protein n=1 Tax=Aquimarina aggregata TaxID=1642818 RepID=UPI00249068B3|nr:hypothetical protein [Aquimarina aggregata]
MKIKILVYISIITLGVTTCLGCKDTTNEIKNENLISNKKNKKAEIEFSRKQENSKKIVQDTLSFKLSNNFSIKKTERILSLFNSKNELIASNHKIIKLKDESENCLSDGFQKIVVKNNFFTIEQQNCSNKFFINEYITFKYDKISNSFLLHKLGYVYSNKSNPNEKKPDVIFTNKDFGKITFLDLDLISLYINLINKK